MWLLVFKLCIITADASGNDFDPMFGFSLSKIRRGNCGAQRVLLGLAVL